MLIKAESKSWISLPPTEYARKLSASIMMKRFLDETHMIINGQTPPRRYNLLSGHDSNVSNMLKTMNPTLEWSSVKYADAVHFELFSKGGAYFVRMLNKGTALKLEMCNGKTYCDLDEFKD